MRTLILILMCFSASFAFALLMAGWSTLLAVEDSEIEEIGAAGKLPPNAGFLRMLRVLPKIQWQVNREMMARIPGHWRTRKSARVMILSALACVGFTALGLYWLSATGDGYATPRTQTSPADSQ